MTTGLRPSKLEFGVAEFGLQIVGDALRGEADVVEGEIARDDAAPAAGAEFDHVGVHALACPFLFKRIGQVIWQAEA